MRGTISEGMAVVPGYRLVQFLGKGGFGEVWKAIGPGKVPLALKIIELKGSKAGQREFRSLDLLRELRHPNLLPMQGYWLLDENGAVLEDEQGEAATLVIAMLLGEKSLRQRLEDCERAGSPGIPVNELMEYLRDAAKGIDFLNSPRHDFGEGPVSIQHRDIKPENLLIVGGGVMLADFGISRILGSDSNVVMTETAAMTIWYAAPELFDFKASLWTDQYALAITYYELRTGRLPFPPGATPTSVMAAHLRGRHDFSALSSAEQAALRRATAIVPQERYPTCIELIVDLATALQGVDLSRCGSEPQAANLAALSGGAPSAAKQLDILVRTSAQSSKSLGSALGTSATHVTEPLSRDATQSERPGDGTCFFVEHGPSAPAADVAPSEPRDLSETVSREAFAAPPVAPRWLRAALVVAAAVVLALPLGWWVGTRLLRNSSSEPDGYAPSSGRENGAGPLAGDESHVPAQPGVDAVQAARATASAALEKGDFTQLINALDPIIRDGHGTSDDFRTRARASLRLADLGNDPPANLRRAADDFAAAYDPDAQVDAITRLGRWLEQNGQPREAVKVFQELVELERSPGRLIALSGAQAAAGQPDAAREAAAEALELAGRSDERESKEMAAHARRALAQALIHLGDTLDKLEPRAPEAVEDAERRAEEQLEAAIALAEELKMNEVEAWRNALSQFREIPRVAAHIKARRLLMLIAELRKQLHGSPNDATVLLKLSDAEAAAGDTAAAERHFVHGHTRQAIELVKQGKTNEAESAIARAADKDAGHSLVHFARGLVAVQKGDDDAAIHAFDASIQATKDD